MPQYLGQSFEELRFEDYVAGVKNQNAAPAPAAAPAFGASPGTTSTPTGFGFGAAASSSPGFGASTAGSVFGQASAASPFGGTSSEFGEHSWLIKRVWDAGCAQGKGTGLPCLQLDARCQLTPCRQLVVIHASEWIQN